MKEKQDTLTLCAVGDVIVARKEYMKSFTQVGPILRGADISFFNCEAPYAEVGSPGGGPTGAGCHDPGKMPALVDAGFGVCTLANNHSLDWGVDALVECRQRLEALGIAVCGAGRNITEARKPAIVERKGLKVAFLGYNSVGPNGYMAEDNKPGCAMVRAYTHHEPIDFQPGTPGTKVFTWAYKEDLQAMVDDIKKAKEQADLVVMTDHWGIHFVRAAIPDYEYEVAYAAIDAGADLVLGHHAHLLKGFEVYKGKVIAHGLSSFLMEGQLAEREGEQRTMPLKSFRKMKEQIYGQGEGARKPEQRKVMILKCSISGKKIQRVSYIPVMLDEIRCNPEPLTRSDPRAQDVYQHVQEITREAGLGTKYHWDGDEVVVATE